MAVRSCGIADERPAEGSGALATLTGAVRGRHTEGDAAGHTIDAGDADVRGAIVRSRPCADLRVEGNKLLAAGEQADDQAGGTDAEAMFVVDNSSAPPVGDRGVTSGDGVGCAALSAPEQRPASGGSVARRSTGIAGRETRARRRRAGTRKPGRGTGHPDRANDHATPSTGEAIGIESAVTRAGTRPSSRTTRSARDPRPILGPRRVYQPVGDAGVLDEVQRDRRARPRLAIQTVEPETKRIWRARGPRVPRRLRWVPKLGAPHAPVTRE